jgi:hypothetical protein
MINEGRIGFRDLVHTLVKEIRVFEITEKAEVK